ncbi:MAG TPA: NifU N-terminal domain-containing protein [Rubricoccaceae bacterium]
MTVTVRPTPNPDALMFRLDGATAVPSGLLAFHSAAEAADHPLGAALFALRGVASILVVPAFVTVTKRPDASWDPLVADVERVLTEQVGA